MITRRRLALIVCVLVTVVAGIWVDSMRTTPPMPTPTPTPTKKWIPEGWEDFNLSISYDDMFDEDVTAKLRQLDKDFASSLHAKFYALCYNDTTTHAMLRVHMLSNYNSTRTVNITVEVRNEDYDLVSGINATLDTSFFDIQPKETKTLLLNIAISDKPDLAYEIPNFEHKPFIIMFRIYVLKPDQGKLHRTSLLFATLDFTAIRVLGKRNER